MQDQKQLIYEKFQAEQPYWEEMYHRTDYNSKCFQRRQAVGLELCRRFVKPGGRILDVGCGCGHASLALAREGYRTLGLDIAEQMIEQAIRHAELLNLVDSARFQVTDFEKDWQSLGKFDGILGLGFLEYFEDPIELLTACRQVLSPGGVIVMHIWNRLALSAVVEEPLLWLLHGLAHPIALARMLARKTMPEALLKKIRGRPLERVSTVSDLAHRKSSPAEMRVLAGAAELEIVAAKGSRLFSGRSLLPDPLKERLERGFEGISEKYPSLYRVATDYTVVLRPRNETAVT